MWCTRVADGQPAPLSCQTGALYCPSLCCFGGAEGINNEEGWLSNARVVMVESRCLVSSPILFSGASSCSNRGRNLPTYLALPKSLGTLPDRSAFG